MPWPQKENSIRSIAYRVLKKKNKPMSVREIAELILKEIELKGKTPKKSVSSVLQRCHEFVKVSNGYRIKKAKES